MSSSDFVYNEWGWCDGEMYLTVHLSQVAENTNIQEELQKLLQALSKREREVEVKEKQVHINIT